MSLGQLPAGKFRENVTRRLLFCMRLSIVMQQCQKGAGTAVNSLHLLDQISKNVFKWILADVGEAYS